MQLSPLRAAHAATPAAPTTSTPAAPTRAPEGAAPTVAAASLLPGDALRSARTAITDAIQSVRDLFRRDHEPLPTGGPIDLSRYTGKWYELARMPTRFQNPRSVSTAEYALRPDGSVSVHNTALLGDRTVATIDGTATVADGAANDRLRVRFGGLLKLIPVAKQGNYYILDTTDDYSMALVGTPDRRNLWLLSRDPQAWDTSVAQSMVTAARGLGFDTSKLLVADWDKREMRTPAA